MHEPYHRWHSAIHHRLYMLPYRHVKQLLARTMLPLLFQNQIINTYCRLIVLPLHMPIKRIQNSIDVNDENIQTEQLCFFQMAVTRTSPHANDRLQEQTNNRSTVEQLRQDEWFSDQTY